MNPAALLNPFIWISALVLVLFLLVNVRIVRSVASPKRKQHVVGAMVLGGVLGIVGQSAAPKEVGVLSFVAFLYAWVVAFIDNYEQGKKAN